MEPPRAKKVLLVRSASHYALLQAMEAAREDLGAEEFGILVQPRYSESVRGLGRVHVTSSDEPFSAESLPDGIDGYDAVVPIYAGDLGLGWENVDRTAAAAGARFVIGYDASVDEWLDPFSDETSEGRESRRRDPSEAERILARIRGEIG